MEHINASHELYGYLTGESYTMRAKIWENVKELFYKEKELYIKI